MISSHAHSHYIAWRKSRINKLDQIFGKEFFRGKRVLEVGAGFGLIGKHLREYWGADVVFTEAREHLVNTIRMMNPKAEVHMIDHENLWDLHQKFDFIIHWGLLYHLDNWKQDLFCTAAHLKPTGILSLESEILDRFGEVEEKLSEPTNEDDQAVGGLGTQMSAGVVENILRSLKLSYKRYDDSDLNADFHHYDWKESDSGKSRSGQRRFWIAKP